MRENLLVLVLAGALAGCGAAAAGTETANEPVPSQPAPPATMDLLPKGTEIEVVLNDTLSTESANVGDRFSVTVRSAIKTQSGQPVVPEGSVIVGLVTGVDDSDHANDPAYLRLNFVRLTLGEANHPFAAEILSTNLGAQAGVQVKDAESSATVGAVAGAVVGAVISGDVKTALEQAKLGAGAGSVISLGTRELLPAGTVLRIRTTANISLEH